MYPYCKVLPGKETQKEVREAAVFVADVCGKEN